MAGPRTPDAAAKATGATCSLVITGAPADLGDRLVKAAQTGGLDSASELATAMLESALADLKAASSWLSPANPSRRSSRSDGPGRTFRNGKELRGVEDGRSGTGRYQRDSGGRSESPWARSADDVAAMVAAGRGHPPIGPEAVTRLRAHCRSVCVRLEPAISANSRSCV